MKNVIESNRKWDCDSNKTAVKLNKWLLWLLLIWWCLQEGKGVLRREIARGKGTGWRGGDELLSPSSSRWFRGIPNLGLCLYGRQWVCSYFTDSLSNACACILHLIAFYVLLDIFKEFIIYSWNRIDKFGLQGSPLD